jgi:hypothetical protein
MKESLWAGSYIGVMGIDKRSGDTLDPFNQTGGVDTRLVFFKDWFVDAHMAGTKVCPGAKRCAGKRKRCGSFTVLSL